MRKALIPALCCAVLIGIAAIIVGAASNQHAREYHVYFTGSGAMAESFTAAGDVDIVEVRVLLDDITTTEPLTITLGSVQAAVHDANFVTQGMSGVSSVIWRPEKDVALRATEQLDFALANAAGNTWGIEVVAR